jgi:hypothetical protein
LTMFCNLLTVCWQCLAIFLVIYGIFSPLSVCMQCFGLFELDVGFTRTDFLCSNQDVACKYGEVIFSWLFFFIFLIGKVSKTDSI